MKLKDGSLGADLQGSVVKVHAKCDFESGLYMCATMISDLAAARRVPAGGALEIVARIVLEGLVGDVVEQPGSPASPDAKAEGGDEDHGE